jgi:hypothetical protein
MTCEDYRTKYGVKDPWSLAVAERTAAIRHVVTCPDCMQWHKARAEDEKRRGLVYDGPDREEIGRRLRQDFADPEA